MLLAPGTQNLAEGNRCPELSLGEALKIAAPEKAQDSGVAATTEADRVREDS